MTYEKLLEIVKAASYFDHPEEAAASVIDFGEKNEITPAMQDEIEEMVRAGAEERGINPDIAFHFFETDLELLKVDEGWEFPFKFIYRAGLGPKTNCYNQAKSAAIAVDKFRKLHPHPIEILEAWCRKNGEWLREI
jgi:hypothetical protein